MRGTFCGTPLYVSPELLKRKSYNNKIDVWSVGILTYELLFGRVPFEITTEQDFMKIVRLILCRLKTKSSFPRQRRYQTRRRTSFLSVWRKTQETDSPSLNFWSILSSPMSKAYRWWNFTDNLYASWLILIPKIHLYCT